MPWTCPELRCALLSPGQALRVTNTALLGDKRWPWHCAGGSRAAGPASALSALQLHHICKFGAFFFFLADAVLRFVLLVQGLRKGPGVGGAGTSQHL